MKYKTVFKLNKRPKVVVRLKKNSFKLNIPKTKAVFKVPKEIITKLKVLESVEGSYFSDSLVKTLKGEYFS